MPWPESFQSLFIKSRTHGDNGKLSAADPQLPSVAQMQSDAESREEHIASASALNNTNREWCRMLACLEQFTKMGTC